MKYVPTNARSDEWKSLTTKGANGHTHGNGRANGHTFGNGHSHDGFEEF